jgi:hypothetical protein
LLEAATRAGAQLADASEREARFRVANDHDAARLVETLVALRVQVVEIVPDESRLERLFAETPATAQVATSGSATSSSESAR